MASASKTNQVAWRPNCQPQWPFMPLVTGNTPCVYSDPVYHLARTWQKATLAKILVLLCLFLSWSSTFLLCSAFTWYLTFCCISDFQPEFFAWIRTDLHSLANLWNTPTVPEIVSGSIILLYGGQVSICGFPAGFGLSSSMWVGVLKSLFPWFS